MADLAALIAAVDAAQAAKSALKAERIEKRNTLLKQDFKDYNLVTGNQQREVHAALISAEKAYNAELKVIRADAADNAINVAVGTISESNSPGGTS
jgi:hypothetical protein